MDTNFIPQAPGCYIFRDSAGDCLYVGKSKNLRSRVRSYFTKSDDPKVIKLAVLIKKIEFRTTADEIEALYLEHSLIKAHRPPFNMQMKKEPHHHYICINWGRAKPGLYISGRQNPEPEATLYGCFFSIYDARDALSAICRAWQLPRCEYPHFDNPGTGCLNMHINHCVAPCRYDHPSYMEKMKEAAVFLQGRSKPALAAIKKEMDEAVHIMDFEKAAQLRDVLTELKSLAIRFNNRIEFNRRKLCVIVKGHHEPGLLVLYYKNGRLQHKLRLTNPEDWQVKRNGFILGITNQTKSLEPGCIYTSAATAEIRARKIYVDITHTTKANLPARLDNAVARFNN